MKRKILISLACTALFGTMTIGLLGCSDKQEEADALQQQMMDGPDTITRVDTAAMPVDTMGMEPDASAVPDEEPTMTGLPSQPAGSGFALQVAACESADYARYMVDKYTERGYQPWVTEVTHDGQLYYRVRLGPFETEQAARQVKLELEDRYSITAWIDPI